MTTWWHDERLGAVLEALRGAARVLDVGCGAGDLVMPLLALPGVEAVVALDPDRARLEALRARLPAGEGRVTLVHGSAAGVDGRLAGFDACALVEVIEHLDPATLAAAVRGVFGLARPGLVVVTTPNAEFNPLLGVPARRFRHPGQRFEWGRAQFAGWAGGVARAHGYAVACRTIAGAHPVLGGASQMAVFRRG